MSNTPTIFSITKSTTCDKLDVTSVWSQTNIIPEGLAQLFSITINSQVLIVGINNTYNAYVFKVNSDVSLNEIHANISFITKFDIIVPVVIANNPHLITYTSSNGIFNIYPVKPDLTLDKPFTYYRNHDPGKTDGFTIVQPFTIFGALFYLGYNFSTGKVCIYSLSVTSTSTGGLPPLTSNIAWDHLWAPGWTRFAFFRLGGENFFLKTNIGKPNVNIDHIIDVPSNGTVEVATNLTLVNELTLDIVVPFYIGSDAYFITYQKSGDTSFNRINGDCMSWQNQAALQTIIEGTHIVSFFMNNETHVLFY